MGTRPSRRFAGLSTLAIALVLNLAAHDVCRAGDSAGAGSGAATDSTRTERGSVQAPIPSASARETQLVVPGDGDVETPGRQIEEPETAGKDTGTRTPIYKNKWLWAAGAGVLLATVIAIAAGGGDKSARELPGFPPPPGR